MVARVRAVRGIWIAAAEERRIVVGLMSMVSVFGLILQKLWNCGVELFGIFTALKLAFAVTLVIL